jgi:hypothetical protein
LVLRADRRHLYWILEEQRGIDPRAVPTRAEVKMRACHAAGRTDCPYRLAFVNVLPGLHGETGEVEVHRNETAAMIDEHGVAGEEQILREHDMSVGRSGDTCPKRVIRAVGISAESIVR